jgi:hypothetical protein
MTRIWLSSVACGMFLVLGLGCSGGSRSGTTQEGTGGKLTGKVTFAGKPVTGGMMKLYPAKGEPIPCMIGPDGIYASPSNLPSGQMAVSIDTESAKTGEGGAGGGREAKFTDPEMARLMGQLKKPRYVEIPAKYKDPSTSGLSVTITKGEQTKDFDLKP